MDNNTKRRCAACRAALSDGSVHYTLRLDLFAAPEAGESTAADFERDGTDELAWLLARLKHLDEVELKEEERRVFERFSFSLCQTCRRNIHQRLRHLQHGLEQGQVPAEEQLH